MTVRSLSRLIVVLGIFASIAAAVATIRRRQDIDADGPIVCPPVDCYLNDLMVRVR